MAAISAAVPCGLRCDVDSTPLGASVLLARSLSLGSQRFRSSDTLAFAIETLGGTFGVNNDQDMCSAMVTVPADRLLAGLDALVDLLSHPLFPVAALSRERRRCREQLLASAAIPASRAGDLVDQLLWPDSPIGKSAREVARSLRTITRDDVVHLHSTTFGAQGVVVSIATPGSLEQALDASLHAVETWPTGGTPNLGGPGFGEGRCAAAAMPADLVYLAIAAPAVPRGHPDAETLNLLAVMLGGGTTSRLFVEIREKRGLCYDIGCRFVPAATTGAIVIEAGVPPDQFAPASAAIVEQCRQVTSTSAQGELDRARALLLGSLAMQSDRPETWSQRFCRDLLQLNRPRPFSELVATFRAISLEQVHSVAQRYLSPEHLRIAVAGPGVTVRSVVRACAQW
ncbi:MAG: insulinase family protein [Chloroflexi bacterium]|nr:insulinase family protein [Chloroflexota bacterium]